MLICSVIIILLVCLFYNKTFITFTFFMINVSQTTFLLIKCRIKIKQLIYLLFQVNCCTHSALSRLFHINFSSTKKVNEKKKRRNSNNGLVIFNPENDAKMMPLIMDVKNPPSPSAQAAFKLPPQFDRVKRYFWRSI